MKLSDYSVSMAAANHFGGLKTTINSCKSNQRAETGGQKILSKPLLNDMNETFQDVYIFVRVGVMGDLGICDSI